MTLLTGIHHIAIICSDYARSKHFYTDILGLAIVRETYREARRSFKLDLALGDRYLIELFSFPDPPPRASGPEACGLRHLAFAVDDLDAAIRQLSDRHIATEPVRVDELTGKRFTFLRDPDELPIELYES